MLISSDSLSKETKNKKETFWFRRWKVWKKKNTFSTALEETNKLLSNLATTMTTIVIMGEKMAEGNNNKRKEVNKCNSRWICNRSS